MARAEDAAVRRPSFIDRTMQPARSRSLLCASAYVTTPVWVSMLLLAASHFNMSDALVRSAAEVESHTESPSSSPSPETKPAANSSEIEELHKLLWAERSKVRELRANVTSAEARLAQAQRRVKDLEGTAAEGEGPGPVGEMLQSVNQTLVAFLFLAIGILSVIGPMTFVHVWKTVVGSAWSGLMVAASFGFLFAGSGAGWMESLNICMAGKAVSTGYFLGCATLLGGVGRWYWGWEWVMYAVVDDMYMKRPIANGFLKTPLLNKAAKKGGENPEEDVPEGGDLQTGEAADQGLEGLDTLLHMTSMARTKKLDQKGEKGWHFQFWADAAQEISRGDVSDDVVVALMHHGFNPEYPREASPPSLEHLQQALTDMRAQLTQGDEFAGDGAVDEV